MSELKSLARKLTALNEGTKGKLTDVSRLDRRDCGGWHDPVSCVHGGSDCGHAGRVGRRARGRIDAPGDYGLARRLRDGRVDCRASRRCPWRRTRVGRWAVCSRRDCGDGTHGGQKSQNTGGELHDETGA